MTMIKELQPIPGTKSFRCVHRRCPSCGNRVTAKHVHTYLPTSPLSQDLRVAGYMRQNGSDRLTARQRRALRRAARRSVAE